mgnify:CR=1 FL=1
MAAFLGPSGCARPGVVGMTTRRPCVVAAYLDGHRDNLRLIGPEAYFYDLCLGQRHW